jgi:hypothetical protein
MHEKIEYRCELMLGKENGEALEDFDEYLIRRRERRERNDDDSDDDDSDDDDDDSSGWDSDEYEKACEKDKVGLPGDLMRVLNNYVDIRREVGDEG